MDHPPLGILSRSALRVAPWALPLLAACGSTPPHPAPQTEIGPSMRGLSPVSSTVCWASGERGTVLRTTDGGTTWDHHQVPVQTDLRDIQAFDDTTAIAMGITKPASLWRTADGGSSWTEVFQHPHEDAFLDTLAFWDPQRGVAFGDPIDGAFLWLETNDSGETWNSCPVPLPPPLDGEGGFAASGSMVCATGDNELWIGTSHYGRLFHRATLHGPWNTQASPLRSGHPSAGVFSVAVRSDGRGLLVGGQYDKPEEHLGTAAYTTDGGKRWRTPASYPRGYRSGVAWSPDGSVAVAVGPDGVDVTRNGGEDWTAAPGPGWHSVAFSADGTCWVSGSDGRAQQLRLPPP